MLKLKKVFSTCKNLLKGVENLRSYQYLHEQAKFKPILNSFTRDYNNLKSDDDRIEVANKFHFYEIDDANFWDGFDDYYNDNFYAFNSK